jgi:hypothetical protein
MWAQILRARQKTFRREMFKYFRYFQILVLRCGFVNLPSPGLRQEWWLAFPALSGPLRRLQVKISKYGNQGIYISIGALIDALPLS